MPEAELDTLQLCRCVERWQAGDRHAADELLHAAGQRLEHLTRKMLRSYPDVRQWTETADVLQGSLLRLLHTLRSLSPAGTRDFFGLAALHIRRELLDLARRFAAQAPAVKTTDQEEPPDEAGGAAAADLDLWALFHEAVESLPIEEREVIGLRFYHGWTQAQVAELFAVDERTVRRRWQAACLQLQRLVGGELPGN